MEKDQVDEDFEEFQEEDIQEIIQDHHHQHHHQESDQYPHGNEDDGSDDNQDMALDDDDNEGIVFEDDSIQGFFGHGGEPVYAIAIHPLDRNLACSGGGDDCGHLWRTDTGDELAIFKGHLDSVVSTTFNYNGSLVATGGMDGKVLIWSTVFDSSDVSPVSSVPIATLEGPDEIIWTAWHPKGNVLAAGGQDGNVWMWNIQQHHQQQQQASTVMNVFSKHSSSVTCGQFTPDGKYLLTAGDDGVLILWDPKTADVIWKVGPSDSPKWHQCGIVSIAASPDCKLIASGDVSGCIRLSQLSTGKLVSELDSHSDAVEALEFNPDFTTLPILASGGMDGNVILWDLHTLKIRSTLKHTDGVNHLQFAGNNRIVCASVDRIISSWDFKAATKLREWKGHQEVILSMAIKDDICVTAGDDGVCLAVIYSTLISFDMFECRGKLKQGGAAVSIQKFKIKSKMAPFLWVKYGKLRAEKVDTAGSGDISDFISSILVKFPHTLGHFDSAQLSLCAQCKNDQNTFPATSLRPGLPLSTLFSITPPITDENPLLIIVETLNSDPSIDQRLDFGPNLDQSRLNSSLGQSPPRKEQRLRTPVMDLKLRSSSVRTPPISLSFSSPTISATTETFPPISGENSPVFEILIPHCRKRQREYSPMLDEEEERYMEEIENRPPNSFSLPALQSLVSPARKKFQILTAGIRKKFKADKMALPPLEEFKEMVRESYLNPKRRTRVHLNKREEEKLFVMIDEYMY